MVDALVPLDPALYATSRDVRSLTVVARVAEGATRAGARDELDAITARLADVHPDTNAGSLLLEGALSRAREIGVRCYLGAGGGDLARPFLAGGSAGDPRDSDRHHGGVSACRPAARPSRRIGAAGPPHRRGLKGSE